MDEKYLNAMKRLISDKVDVNTNVIGKVIKELYKHGCIREAVGRNIYIRQRYEELRSTLSKEESLDIISKEFPHLQYDTIMHYLYHKGEH